MTGDFDILGKKLQSISRGSFELEFYFEDGTILVVTATPHLSVSEKDHFVHAGVIFRYEIKPKDVRE